MQLSLHADYAFRVLLYLGTHRRQIVRTQDISAAYGISKHHLVRVVQTLGDCGYVEIHTGRTGGVSLAREPHEIRLGQVIREAEPNLRLVECFDRKTNTCPISPACALKSALADGLEAFLHSLDQYSLADMLTPELRRKLVPLLTI
jgi:Rrf2 family transcriptional regulator, nitric oxide-sensitive transcriptional repressor